MCIRDRFKAVANDIEQTHAKGQPVLVGTISIEKSEELSSILKKRGIPHQVLNAKSVSYTHLFKLQKSSTDVI